MAGYPLVHNVVVLDVVSPGWVVLHFLQVVLQHARLPHRLPCGLVFLQFDPAQRGKIKNKFKSRKSGDRTFSDDASSGIREPSARLLGASPGSPPSQGHVLGCCWCRTMAHGEARGQMRTKTPCPRLAQHTGGYKPGRALLAELSPLPQTHLTSPSESWRHSTARMSHFMVLAPPAPRIPSAGCSGWVSHPGSWLYSGKQ